MMKRGKVLKDISIMGCVAVAERDDNNEADAIVISTDKEDYVIEPKGVGRDLLTMEGEEIVVKGKLIIDNGGNKRIRVSTYDLIDDAYYEENDFYHSSEDYDDDDYDYDDDGGDFFR